MSQGFDIVGLCGSLRRGSFNGHALALAGRCLPAGTRYEPLSWRDVPPFNDDVLTHEGFPPAVAALHDRIRAADGLIIATPEYNFSIPGMLKNLLDWLSRGADQPLAHKPVAILSAATGPLGGARVQYELRRVLLCVNATVLVKPEVFIGQASSKFDDQGQCIDEVTETFVRAQMQAFVLWLEQARTLAVHRA